MIDQVLNFNDLVTTTNVPSDRRMRELAKALDGLASAYHQVWPKAPKDDDDVMPSHGPSHEDLRARLARRFPELGPYAPVVPEYGTVAVMTTGNALDDLVDIAREMHEIAWLWANGAYDQACWQFRFGYGLHWGRHLHNLRSYLYAELFEA